MNDKYSVDFETTTKKDDCRAWLWGCSAISDYSFNYGIDMESFIQNAIELNNPTFYIHNLKFDSEFIVSWLLEHGYTWVKDKKHAHDSSFTCLVSGSNTFYSLCVYFEKSKHKCKKVEILNSLNIFNFSVEKIAKAFKLPIEKLDIDYTAERAIGYMPTIKEINYVKNDCEIVARALHEIFDIGLDKMTIASNGLHDLKFVLTNKKFTKWFPPLYEPDAENEEDVYKIDRFIRKSYKGGYTYLLKKEQGKEQKEGIILDYNSLYPFRNGQKAIALWVA